MKEKQLNLHPNVLSVLVLVAKQYEGQVTVGLQEGIKRSRRPSRPSMEEIARRVHGDKVIDQANAALENNI